MEQSQSSLLDRSEVHDALSQTLAENDALRRDVDLKGKVCQAGLTFCGRMRRCTRRPEQPTFDCPPTPLHPLPRA